MRPSLPQVDYSTLQLRVPALRELPEDLPWLWKSTLRVALQRSGAPIQDLSIDEKHHDLIVNRLRECPLNGNLRDLFRVANKLIAALCAQENEVSADEAIESAFRGQLEGHSDVALEVAKAFCNSSTLDHLLPSGARLATADVEIQLHSFIAVELRRIARLRGIETEEICDVSE